MPQGGRRANSGRKRKPLSVHKIDGTVPEYAVGNGLRAEGSPIQPAEMTDAARKLWDGLLPLVVAYCAEVDSLMLAAACEWHVAYAAAMRSGELRGASMAWANFDKIASRFGLTPSDRAKMEIPQPATREEREQKFYGVTG